MKQFNFEWAIRLILYICLSVNFDRFWTETDTLYSENGYSHTNSPDWLLYLFLKVLQKSSGAREEVRL